MNNAEVQYLEILQKILDNGVRKSNRTGVDTLSLWGMALRHDYEGGLPLITTKKMFTKGIIHELLWFLKGTEDPSYLLDNNVHIWDEWIVDGKLPFTYGTRWRNFYGFDQIANVINEIKTNPDSRRHVVSAWDPPNVKNCALPWCHCFFQFNIDQDKYIKNPPQDGRKGDISIAVLQRSCDFFLGCGFNLSSYSFLLYMIAEVTGYRPKSMYYTFHDAHIYINHIEQAQEQLSRKPFSLPRLKLNHKDNIDDFVYEDFEIIDYSFHPAIKAEVAV